MPKGKNRSSTDVDKAKLDRVRAMVIHMMRKGQFGLTLTKAIGDALDLWCVEMESKWGKPDLESTTATLPTGRRLGGRS